MSGFGKIGSPTGQPVLKYRSGREDTQQDRVQRAIAAGLRARRQKEKEEARRARLAARA
jgi:hypothetical protein